MTVYIASFFILAGTASIRSFTRVGQAKEARKSDGRQMAYLGNPGRHSYRCLRDEQVREGREQTYSSINNGAVDGISWNTPRGEAEGWGGAWVSGVCGCG